jgi:osmotically-inducible protein OsmY
VTDLIVERGLLRTDERVVPVSYVDRATEDYVMLSISEPKLDECPEYQSYKYDVVGEKSAKRAIGSKPMTTYISTFGPVMTRGYMPVIRRQQVHQNVEPNQEVVTRGAPVRNQEEKIGSLDHMLVDAETSELTHLVLDPGIFSESVVLPISKAKRMDENGILVDLEANELDQFPAYSPRDEDEILEDLRGHLDTDGILEQLDMRVENGVLLMDGVVPDVFTKRRLDYVARTLEGVVDVENRLQPKNAMESKVATALAKDPRTALAVIEVIEDRNQVTLRGQVDSVEIQQAAIEIAESQPGVLNVINALVIKEDEFSSAFEGTFPEKLLSS